jgi:hypothetical protein
MVVDLPDPVAPMTPTRSPAEMAKESSFSTRLVSGEYLNETESKANADFTLHAEIALNEIGA